MQLYTGNGSTTNFTIPFPYLEKSHVKLKVDGVTTSFTFISDSLISITPAPISGAVIQLYRETPRSRLVDYINGSIQDADTFDLDSDQLLFLILECFDEFAKSLSRVPVDRDNKMYQNIDMNNYAVVNLKDPENPKDAVTKEYADAISLGVIDDASETVKGIIQLATQVEANLGVNDTKAITAKKLKAYVAQAVPDATELVKGIIQIASNVEITDGTNTTKAVNPAQLAGAIAAFITSEDLPTASESVPGIVELATVAESTTGTDTQRAVTPAGLKAAIDAIPSGVSYEPPIGSVMTSVANPDVSKYVRAFGQLLTSASYPAYKTLLGNDYRYFNSSTDTPTGVVGMVEPANTQKAVAKTSTGFIATTANYVEYSTDAINWSSISIEGSRLAPTSNVYRVAVSSNGSIVNLAGDSVLGSGVGTIARSVNGGSSFTVSTVSTNTIIDILYVGSILCVIDSTGGLYTSDDNGASFYAPVTIATTSIATPYFEITGKQMLGIMTSTPNNLIVYSVAAGSAKVVKQYQLSNTPACRGSYNPTTNTIGTLMSDRALIVNLEDGTEDTVAHPFTSGGGLGVLWVAGDSYLILRDIDLGVTHDNFETISSLESTFPDIQASANTFSRTGDEVLIGCSNSANTRSLIRLTLVESNTQFKNITIDGLLSNNKIQNFVKVL